MHITRKLVLALVAAFNACAPTPSDVWASPDDIWTWQVSRNYLALAHCVANALNGGRVHSWFLQAPRPITSFEQQWQLDKVILKSVDPLGVEQVRIQVIGDSERSARIIASAKNLEALGGGAPMYYVRAYVDFCSRS